MANTYSQRAVHPARSNTTGLLEYSRAGHNPPYLMDGSVEPLRGSSGLPLGVFAAARHNRGSAQLKPGDTVLLFTDGITESMNRDREQFGEERLIELLREQEPGVRVETITGAVTTAARHFANGAAVSDDMTVLGVRYRGTE